MITHVALLNFGLQGLIVSSRKESLQHFKQPWAHEYEPVKDLIGAVNVRYELIFKSLDFSFIKILIFTFLLKHFQTGNQTNRSHWNLWCGSNFHKGSSRGHGYKQRGLFLFLFTPFLINKSSTAIVLIPVLLLVYRNR